MSKSVSATSATPAAVPPQLNRSCAFWRLGGSEVPAAGSSECTSKTSTHSTLSDMTDRPSGAAEEPGSDLMTGEKKGLTPLLASQRVPHDHVLLQLD